VFLWLDKPKPTFVVKGIVVDFYLLVKVYLTQWESCREDCKIFFTNSHRSGLLISSLSWIFGSKGNTSTVVWIKVFRWRFSHMSMPRYGHRILQSRDMITSRWQPGISDARLWLNTPSYYYYGSSCSEFPSLVWLVRWTFSLFGKDARHLCLTRTLGLIVDQLAELMQLASFWDKCWTLWKTNGCCDLRRCGSSERSSLRQHAWMRSALEGGPMGAYDLRRCGSSERSSLRQHAWIRVSISRDFERRV
jgi:hypothetical protein